MELSFSELRAKEVINTQDGRKLGKVCDIALCYPENRWLGIIVPGTKGWRQKKNELFIDLKQIIKVGSDVVLVNIGLPTRQEDGRRCGYCPPGKPMHPGEPGNRNFEECE